ncbi:HEPN domain-containing protein [Psychrobacter sp. GP33]|uniref:HEPN domain-containing protein n=1 Tax=Psychrobacter sp. GP33 TaxID=2758709 RepID=UPI0015F912DB|nr:HEPN domain-containing protein [Psychrobacter sp. GP33]
MSATKEDIEDFNIIFEEIKSLREIFKLSPEMYSKEFDSDIDRIASTLQSQQNAREAIENQVQFFLSSKAQKKLYEIAKRQCLSLDNITVNECIYEIRSSLYLHLKNKRAFDASGCMKLISKVRKNVNAKAQEITYFFPFNAPSLSLDKEIQIGNVKIIHKDSVYAKVSDNRNYNRFVKSNNHNSFNCLLSITIPKCSNKMSKNRAQNTAEFIFGVIKVFTTLHEFEAAQVNLISNPTKSDITHYIANNNDDEYWIGGSYSFSEDLQGFWDSFEEDLKSDLGLVIAKLISRAVSPSNTEFLADRLIDAFYWFGDASRDNNSSAQVVKLVTAMERLVTVKNGEKNEGITKNFCRRVSCLIAVYHGEIDEWSTKAEKVYKLRSDFVHGRQSIYKTYGTELGFDPFQLACPTILSACIIFYKLGLELSPYEAKLKSAYVELSEICEDEKYKMKKVMNS